MKLTVRQAESALKQTAGNVMMAARALNVSRSTLYRRINESPELLELLTDTREELVDIAESALRKNVLDGNMSAVAYVLNNAPEAKRRGWGPTVGPDGQSIAIMVIRDDSAEH
jgi:hypothetical protein